MNPMIFHHDDEDGFCAAWAARKTSEFRDAEVYPVNYGKPWPVPMEAMEGRDVLILDFSWPFQHEAARALREVEETAMTLTVIDHHESVADIVRSLPRGHYYETLSGCGGAWQYFSERGMLPAEVPDLVRYVQDRDLWRFDLPESKEINAWIRSLPRDEAHWDVAEAVLQHKRVVAVAAGEAVLGYQKILAKAQAEKAAMRRFDGHYVPVCNATVLHSETADILAQEHPSSKFSVTWRGTESGGYTLSLRSRGEFDVAALAKKWGGGGHRGAAGFSTRALPWVP